MATLAPLNTKYVKGGNIPFPNLFPLIQTNVVQTNNIQTNTVEVLNNIQTDNIQSYTGANINISNNITAQEIDCSRISPTAIDFYKTGILIIDNASTQSTSGPNLAEYLEIVINGNPYKIQLRSP